MARILWLILMSFMNSHDSWSSIFFSAPGAMFIFITTFQGIQVSDFLFDVDASAPKRSAHYAQHVTIFLYAKSNRTEILSVNLDRTDCRNVKLYP